MFGNLKLNQKINMLGFKIENFHHVPSTKLINHFLTCEWTTGVDHSTKFEVTLILGWN